MGTGLGLVENSPWVSPEFSTDETRPRLWKSRGWARSSSPKTA